MIGIDKYAGIAALTAMVVTTANADFIVVNNPAFDETGNYSDAFGTGGSTEYKTSWAQQFNLNNDYTLSTLKWWGGVNGFFGDGINSITGFQIIIWSGDFSQQVYTANLSTGQYTRVDTQMENFFGQEVYEFSTALPAFLTAGTYNMNIGAWYALSGPGHDQFVWSAGQYSNSTMSTYYTESASLNGIWGDWNPYLGGSFSPAGAMVLTAPSPGVLALMGIGSVIGINTRRRRK